MIARYSGEAFVIVLPECPLEQAVSLSERVCRVIAEYHWHDLHPDLTVTFSIGVQAKEDQTSFGQLMIGAARKLKQAKNSGGNQVCD